MITEKSEALALAKALMAWRTEYCGRFCERRGAYTALCRRHAKALGSDGAMLLAAGPYCDGAVSEALSVPIF